MFCHCMVFPTPQRLRPPPILLDDSSCPLNSWLQWFRGSAKYWTNAPRRGKAGEHNPIYRTNSLLSCGRPCIQLTPMCGGEPGCEIELPDISSLKGSHCIMTGQTPCKEHDTAAFSAGPLERRRRRRAGIVAVAATALWLIIQTISPYSRSITTRLHGVRQPRVICLRSQYIRGYDALNLSARTRRPGCGHINFTRRVNIQQELRVWASPKPPSGVKLFSENAGTGFTWVLLRSCVSMAVFSQNKHNEKFQQRSTVKQVFPLTVL